MNFFNLRSLLPRERRRTSPREVAKGVTGELAGRPRREPEQRKRAQRRAHRRALTKAAVIGLMENPTGSKLLRRIAKNSGFVVVDSDGKRDFVRKPTVRECEDWYDRRESPAFKVGHQGYHPPQSRRATASATRQMGAAT